MSQWRELDILTKITKILSGVEYTDPNHPFGRPYLTAYQVAIEFARCHPDDVAEIGQPLGGLGVGQQSSLSQYIAGGLSRDIRHHRADHIEGGFISNLHLKKISFNGPQEDFDSSLTNTQYDLSMFRLRD